ncbi:MAG TPA: hypothetical protein VE690_05480, partial [Rhodopila sp.]|nr:hypothetical protein [Rhodopila sp.]
MGGLVAHGVSGGAFVLGGEPGGVDLGLHLGHRDFDLMAGLPLLVGGDLGDGGIEGGDEIAQGALHQGRQRGRCGGVWCWRGGERASIGLGGFPGAQLRG